jgi:mannose-6-phosphate isomerase
VRAVTHAPTALHGARDRLESWLTRRALPLWWDRSADLARGGFVERLAQDGTPATGFAKRVRVQARQAYVYGLAAAQGWMVGADRAARHALAGLAAMKGSDGLYRSVQSVGAPLDGMGLLYDQAFALLAFAIGFAAFEEPELEQEARALRERLASFAHPLGGFAEAPGLAEPLFANPNMHLFESFQAWSAASRDPAWAELARGQARLALERLIDPTSGVLHEAYQSDWGHESASRCVVWPGHLFEWGHLLLAWRGGGKAERAAGLRLVDAAERFGVDHRRGVAVFALDGALNPVDRGARLWAQTERLRATAMAASLTGEAALWSAALEASLTLEAFLETPTPGLWRDWMDEAGAFREEPAPASSFYHIVGTIAGLQRALGGG